jgi:hypothetical protein
VDVCARSAGRVFLFSDSPFRACAAPQAAASDSPPADAPAGRGGDGDTRTATGDGCVPARCGGSGGRTAVFELSASFHAAGQFCRVGARLAAGA